MRFLSSCNLCPQIRDDESPSSGYATTEECPSDSDSDGSYPDIDAVDIVKLERYSAKLDSLLKAETKKHDRFIAGDDSDSEDEWDAFYKTRPWRNCL
jgi:hypothetical protein